MYIYIYVCYITEILLFSTSQSSPRHLEPVLVIQGDLKDEDVTGHILAEDLLICETEGLLEGFCTWIAACYAFNCHYHKQHRNTLMFVQKMLGMKLRAKSSLISSIVKKINDENVRGTTV